MRCISVNPGQLLAPFRRAKRDGKEGDVACWQQLVERRCRALQARSERAYGPSGTIFAPGGLVVVVTLECY